MFSKIIPKVENFFEKNYEFLKNDFPCLKEENSFQNE